MNETKDSKDSKDLLIKSLENRLNNVITLAQGNGDSAISFCEKCDKAFWDCNSDLERCDDCSASGVWNHCGSKPEEDEQPNCILCTECPITVGIAQCDECSKSYCKSHFNNHQCAK